MGMALPRLNLGDPTSLKKTVNIFNDHKLLDGERILLKYELSFLPKNWCYCHAPQGGQFFGAFLDNKLHYTKGILISN